MVAKLGREIASVEEAEEFLRHFMAKDVHRKKGTYDPKCHDFDVFLPWVWECIQAERGPSSLSMTDLSMTLMDAAWSLLRKGYLRPGPRGIMGENTAAACGKGYSLTPEGRKWVAVVAEAPATVAVA